VNRDEDFRDFVLMRSSALYRSAVTLTGDRSVAEDLVQVALMRTYEKWDRVAAADDPHAYAQRILYRSFARMHRRRQLPQALGPIADMAHAQDDSSDDRDRLRRALMSLTPKQRAVITLRFYEDFSVEQAATALGVSTGTVKSQTARALGRLRLSPQFEHEEGK
jgi:RNA polymerase sigma-70 factor (sigma-E family)